MCQSNAYCNFYIDKLADISNLIYIPSKLLLFRICSMKVESIIDIDCFMREVCDKCLFNREIRAKLKSDIESYKKNAPNFLPGLAIVQVLCLNLI